MVEHSNQSSCASHFFDQFLSLMHLSRRWSSTPKIQSIVLNRSNHLSTPRLARRSVAIMTTTNGTYMFCDTDGSFSLKLTCAGQSCTSILGRSNLICTQSDSKTWQCNNGVACSGTAIFSSNFSIAQSNE